MIELLTALVESQTAIVEHQLETMRALRVRSQAISARVAELGKVIRASQAYINHHGPANVSKLCTIRQCRARIEAAVAELEELDVEYKRLNEEANIIIAERQLATNFPAPMADA